MDIFVATHNAHKLREIGELLPGFTVHAEEPDVEETAPDFAGNALIKARAIASAHKGCWVMADDSGLEVDALGGEPGVRSARYAGEPSNTPANNALLLKNLDGVVDRRAHFTCCVALIAPDGKEQVVTGRCYGTIAQKASGAGGFGYDPLFIPDGYGKSFAELTADEKNAISHRGRALAEVKRVVRWWRLSANRTFVARFGDVLTESMLYERYRMMRSVGVLLLSVLLGGCSERFEVRGPDNPKAWEKTAVEELNHYLGLCSENGSVKIGWRNAVFHVGDTAFARKKGLSPDSFQDEEWLIKSFGRDVVLAGGGTRGTLYAVYRFLEDDCGVRWWMDGDEDVPPAKPLAFRALDRRGKPFFLCRDIYRTTTSDPRTAVRNRLNGNGAASIPAELGGGFEYGPPYHCHTWDRYLPFAKYGQAHPEWYALVNGERKGGQSVAQMCLTCPGLTDEFSRRLEEFIAEGEADAAAKGVPAPRIYDLSMNDNMRFCTCSNCAAATAKYGHSGRQLNFVNAIAEKAAAKHPDLLFSTFAYYYSEPAPSNGVCAADNVVVKLCNTRQNMAAGIFDEDNRFMHDQVLAWKAFTKNLFVWEYGITYGAGRGYPFPNEFSLEEKYRFYADNGVKGFLVEHEDPDCSDMYELKFRLECKALENPHQDADAIIDDFMSRYYGAAGAKVLEARRLLDRRRRESKAFITWFPTTGEFNFISDDDLAAFERLFNEAAACVKGDAKLEKRVARAYASLRRLTDLRRTFGTKHPPEKGVSDKPFFDFPSSAKGYAIHDHDYIDYVKDPDLGDPLAGGETVLRVTASGNKYYELPFELGVYDVANKRGVASKRWEKPLGSGYRWYSLGRVTLPERSFYLYATRRWTVQLPVSLPGMNGNAFEIKALVKFTGPLFFPGSTEPNEIRIARFAYVEPSVGETF